MKLSGSRRPAPHMQLSILIVNWNTREDLRRCLASILAHPPRVSYDVWVVDNASTDGSSAMVAGEFPRVHLDVAAENLGFARANNRAAARAQGRFWLLLNPDTIVHPGALDALVQYMEAQPRTAAIGPLLLNPDGSPQPSIERLPSLGREWWRLFHLDRLMPLSQYPRAVFGSPLARPVEVLSGACVLLRRQAVQPLGLFDEDYFVYSEEIDLCDRLRQAGWQLHWLPTARVTHRGGQSTRQVPDQMFLELYRNKVLFFRKRRGVWAGRAYKLILLQAALVRYGLEFVAPILPAPRRAAWRLAARQYRGLLAALPGL